ncbi:MAG: hypothetical protein COB24_11600, partial [Hyphomicrobiales bacterium]
MLGTTSLHSLPVLIHLQWAAEHGHTDWQAVGEEFWTAFFDPLIAESIPGIDAFVGPEGDALTVMQSALAYSAIEDGERPFGDTAIWSLFDDIDELGRLAASGADYLDDLVFYDDGADGTYVSVTQSLANLAVQ